MLPSLPPAAHLAPAVLVLAVAALFAPKPAVAGGGNTTCADPTVTWWLNSNGDTPCKLFEEIVDMCQSWFVLWSSNVNTWAFCNATGGGGSNNACCCSSVTFALMSACIYCQNGVTTLSQPEPYGTYLSLGEACTDPGQIRNGSIAVDVSGIGVPDWAYIDVTSGDSSVWNYGIAESNATRSASQMAASSSVSVSFASVASLSSASLSSAAAAAGDTTATTASASDSSSSISSGAIAGIVVALVVAFAGIVGALLIWRRKRKQSYAAVHDHIPLDLMEDDEGPKPAGPVMSTVTPYPTHPAGSSIVAPQTYSQPSTSIAGPQSPYDYYLASPSTSDGAAAERQRLSSHTSTSTDDQSLGLGTGTAASAGASAALKARLEPIAQADEQGAGGQEVDAGPVAPPSYDPGWK